MALRPGPQRRVWIAAAAWLAVIWVATSIPGRMLPEGPEGSDKVAHFVLYTPLGLLLLRALWPARPSGVRAVGVLLLVLAGGAALAWLDELHQQLIPGRTCSAADWRVDLLGLAAGLLLGLIWSVVSNLPGHRRQDPRD
jgi:VanZ family protein